MARRREAGGASLVGPRRVYQRGHGSASLGESVRRGRILWPGEAAQRRWSMFACAQVTVQPPKAGGGLSGPKATADVVIASPVLCRALFEVRVDALFALSRTSSGRCHTGSKLALWQNLRSHGMSVLCRARCTSGNPALSLRLGKSSRSGRKSCSTTRMPGGTRASAEEGRAAPGAWMVVMRRDASTGTTAAAGSTTSCFVGAL